MADKISKTVSWHIPKKSIIKFEGDDDIIEIDSSVICDKIQKGAVVEYTLKDEKIISLSANGKTEAQKEEPKKEEAVKEEPKEEKDSVDKITVVIDKVAPSHEVVGWENSFIKWVPVAKELQFADHTPESEEAWKKQGLLARNEVELTITNKVITAVKVISTPKSASGSSDTNVDKNNSGKADSSFKMSSTSANTVVMCAKDVVVAMIIKGELRNKDVKDAIVDLSKGFSLILKNL
ncbi:MAG: hypothetical protein J7K80_02305 [Candidatus Izimaplasma sp.]|nr:hypothetical protein [Candidatus Izimaplasma bacterium]